MTERGLTAQETDESCLCANEADKSSLDASVDIIVVIWPTLCLSLARPERRRDFRNMAPISYGEHVFSESRLVQIETEMNHCSSDWHTSDHSRWRQAIN